MAETSPDSTIPLVFARIDEAATDFETRTTQGLMRLSDYRGRWLLFFSHKAPSTYGPQANGEE